MKGKGGRTISHITCYKCNRKVYYLDNCPEADDNKNQAEGAMYHIHECEENDGEGEIQDEVGQLIDGEEIEVEGIQCSDDNYDRPIIINLQFAQRGESYVMSQTKKMKSQLYTKTRSQSGQTRRAPMKLIRHCVRGIWHW